MKTVRRRVVTQWRQRSTDGRTAPPRVPPPKNRIIATNCPPSVHPNRQAQLRREIELLRIGCWEKMVYSGVEAALNPCCFHPINPRCFDSNR
ncbi:unnamed protein product [Cercopithifilaria johnstoni]|uniref:Uncharacterized protein n=1 Tax=Cercopithifilaria johnstoni TaxID=2874296 RepID=A0A8J2M8Y8_9BILA|nr:unnamed protein product [Cercopithifilaria johnstoni]